MTLEAPLPQTQQTERFKQAERAQAESASDAATLRISLGRELTLDDVRKFSAGTLRRIALDDAHGRLHEKIARNRAFLDAALARGEDIYGVTTGFGDSCFQRLPAHMAAELQQNLVAYHGCGVGPLFSESQAAATLLVRLNTLAQGASGVTWDLLDALARLADARVFPAIPQMGSVGASGDLTPLSYLAALVQGDRDCYFEGAVRPAREVFTRLGLTPHRLHAKEALALMNGTSVMTAAAVLAWHEANAIAQLACALTAVHVELLQGRTAAFLPELHALKPHPGQQKAAALILAGIARPRERVQRVMDDARVQELPVRASARLQDTYSVRCAPHVIGVLFDVLAWTGSVLTIEMNSVNDNPVVHDAEGLFLNGGHFFGGHVAAASDALKTAVANVLNLIDRQLAILVNPRLNGVLPENLVDTQALGGRAALNHGFKAMQITASALTAEALQRSIPMSIFSRPTEGFNQDVVSMGTIAARDLSHIVALGQSVCAIAGMALAQARRVHPDRPELSDSCVAFLDNVDARFGGLVDDRPLDAEIGRVRDVLFAPGFAESLTTKGEPDGRPSL